MLVEIEYDQLTFDCGSKLVSNYNRANYPQVKASAIISTSFIFPWIKTLTKKLNMPNDSDNIGMNNISPIMSSSIILIGNVRSLNHKNNND